MHDIRDGVRRRARSVALAGVLGAAILLPGCGDFMEVTNPGAIENPSLENPDYIPLMMNGVIGDFQPAFAWTAVWSGAFVDELYNHHSYFEYPALERRQVDPAHGTYALGIYNGLHRVRFLADSVSTRIQTLRGDSASFDVRLATVKAYAGYAWTLLGEQFCETPINASAEMFPSEELFREAIPRFEGAIQVATAASAAAADIANATARARAVARADSIINLSRVGAARAALNLWSYTGDDAFRQQAMQFASAVAPAYESPDSRGFEFQAHFAEGNSFGERRRISNAAWEFITAGRWFSLAHTPFEELDDPRVPKTPEPVRVANGQRQFVPNSPLAYSSYTGSLPGAPIAPDTDIRLASALEARYIIAEAEGLNAANLAFVNERRAIGGDLPLLATATASEYLAALREQRSRDFYLDTHRLGDLRRYKRQHGIDLFPSGAYPDNPQLTYGNQECFPVPLSEENR